MRSTVSSICAELIGENCGHYSQSLLWESGDIETRRIAEIGILETLQSEGRRRLRNAASGQTTKQRMMQLFRMYIVVTVPSFL